MSLPIAASLASAADYVTIKDGKLDRPTGYREWVFVGTPVTPHHKSLSGSAERFPATSYNGCHAAAAADDFVFTQYYPVLGAGKKAGSDAVGGMRSALGMEK